MRLATLFAALLAVPIGILADSVDDFVLKEMQKSKIPGVSIAIVRDGKVEKARGYGLADVEHQTPATA